MVKVSGQADPDKLIGSDRKLDYDPWTLDEMLRSGPVVGQVRSKGVDQTLRTSDRFDWTCLKPSCFQGRMLDISARATEI